METHNEPYFSICIPNFNYGQYLGEAIQSVLDQGFSDFEIVVADNASTDQSVKVVQNFKDSRIKLIQNRTNIGFAPNLQRVSENASGQFVILLSADDRMRSGALKTYFEVLQSFEEDQRANSVLFASTMNIDANGKPLKLQRPGKAGLPWEYAAPSEESLEDGRALKFRGLNILRDSLKTLRTPGTFLSTCYSRSLWKQVEGYQAIRTISPDKFFVYKLLAQDPSVIYVRKCLFEYRIHSSPNLLASQSTLKHQIDDYLYTIEYSEEFLKKLGLTRDELIQMFLKKICLKPGLLALKRGSYLSALQMLAFAIASYPRASLKLGRFWQLTGLLCMGPFAIPAARLIYRILGLGKGSVPRD